MKNLITAVKRHEKAELKARLTDLKACETKEAILSRFNGYKMNRKQSAEFINPKTTIKQAKLIFAALLMDITGKRIIEKVQKIERIANAPDLKKASISVEWKRSRIWGANPNAEAAFDTSNFRERANSGSVGGCGYDKLSTAVANVLNQSDSVLKLLYTEMNRNKNKGKTIREILGYGSGYGILPYIEGGVGVSCYPQIFETCGYKFTQQFSGKSSDYFTIEKK